MLLFLATNMAALTSCANQQYRKKILIQNLFISFTVCRARIDLGFLIDGSRQSGTATFVRIIQYVKETVRRFDVQRTQVRIGLALFASRQRLIFGFSRSPSRAQVYREVGNLRLLRRRRRRTAEALLYAKRYLFSGKPKCGRRRVLILLTTGTSRDNVIRPARILHAVGVEVYAIGVGRVSVRYLRKIATDRYHVFSVSGRRLITIVRTIKDRMCYSPGKSSISKNFSVKRFVDQC